MEVHVTHTLNQYRILVRILAIKKSMISQYFTIKKVIAGAGAGVRAGVRAGHFTKKRKYSATFSP